MVFASLAEQAHTKIRIDSDVPAYRVDAVFAKTPLRDAVFRVCHAAGLHFTTSTGIIRIIP